MTLRLSIYLQGIWGHPFIAGTILPNLNFKRKHFQGRWAPARNVLVLWKAGADLGVLLISQMSTDLHSYFISLKLILAVKIT